MLIEPIDAENCHSCPKKIPDKKKDLKQETVPKMLSPFFEGKLRTEDLFQRKKYGYQSNHYIIDVNAKEVFESFHIG